MSKIFSLTNGIVAVVTKGSTGVVSFFFKPLKLPLPRKRHELMRPFILTGATSCAEVSVSTRLHFIGVVTFMVLSRKKSTKDNNQYDDFVCKGKHEKCKKVSLCQQEAQRVGFAVRFAFVWILVASLLSCDAYVH
jgi:hypothetical protein